MKSSLSFISLVALTGLVLSACSTLERRDDRAAAAATAVPQAEQAPALLVANGRPRKREYAALLELGSLDAVPDVAPLIEFQQQRTRERSLLKMAPAWESVGPNTNLGRVIDIAFHPTNPNIVYVSSPGGGVYRSTDGAVSWTKLTALPYQSVNSIAIDPLNPDVVYFATGHTNGGGSSDQLSLGVYKSTDGGATMSLLGATVPTIGNQDWLTITRLAVHPTIANRVFAATLAGLFISANGGQTWTRSTGVGSIYDIAFDPHNPARVVLGDYFGTFWISGNNGNTWSSVQVVPYDRVNAPRNIRTRFRFARTTPNLIYASIDQNDGEVHKSTDGGVTWTKVSTPGHDENNQGFHTNQLWVSPTDPNHLIVGGVDLFRSTNGGATFTKISDWNDNASDAFAGRTPTTPHADHNAVASPPNYSETNQVFFVGTDGGLFTTNAAKTVALDGWTKNGGNLSVTQFVSGNGKRAGNVDTLVGGTQDNGTIINVGYQGWRVLAGADGGFVVFDPTENYIFGELQEGVVFRSGPTGAQLICAGITETNPERCAGGTGVKLLFYPPLEIDSASRLYLGGNSLWRTVNPKGAVTWTAIKLPLTTRLSATGVSSASTTNYISAISIQASNPSVAIVGHTDGQIFRTTNLTAALPTWTSMTGAPLPTGRMVGAILVDPQDANRIFIGYTGYFSNNLWRSNDGGATWVNVSAGLPPGSIYTITRHPQAKDRVYVGTIWGSYGSLNAGQTWPSVHDGPAAAQVRRLFWLGNETIVASTFGNGMFRGSAPLTYAAIPNIVVEYFHPVLNNYFITADPVEQAAVDSGAAGAEWRRTGTTFKAGGPNQVCRFYGNARANPATGGIYGPNSHFYTVNAAECAGLKAAQNPGAASWFFESNDFNTTPSVAGTCPGGLVPVYRAYNNGFARGIDSNHRITANRAGILEVVAQGWSDEGIVMCAPAS